MRITPDRVAPTSIRMAAVLWLLSTVLAACAAAVTAADGGRPDHAVTEMDGTTPTDGDQGTQDVEPNKDSGRSPTCRMTSYVDSYRDTIQFRYGAVIGEFFADADATHRCESYYEGNCRVIVSTNRVYRDWPALSAGDLMVQWGNHPPVRVTRIVRMYDRLFLNDDPVWMVGDRIRVWTSGDDVPAFSAEVVFPPLVQIRGLERIVERMTIRVRDGMAIEWDHTSAPYVTVSIGASYGTEEHGEFRHLRCNFPGRSGRGLVPPSLLERLLGADRASMAIYSRDHRVLNVGGYEIEVRATNLAHTVRELVLE